MTDERLSRSDIVPEIIREVPAFAALIEAMDEVLSENVDSPMMLMADLRSVTQESSRYVLKHTANLLGFAKRSYYLNEERLARLVTHLPQFRTQNTTEAFKNFLGFLLSYPAGVDDLWTNDYVAFFSVPQGPLLVDDLGNRLAETTPNSGWYNTTHVLLRANARTCFPDADDPYQALREFFYAIAPAYLVLEFIGNIGPLFESQLQLNVGVVEGATIEEYQFPYEVLRLATSWSEGRPLPINLKYHQQSKIRDNDVLLTGGYSNTCRPTAVSAVIDLNSLYWTHVDPPFKDSAVVDAAYDEARGLVLMANDLGELALSRNGGLDWTKVWSPTYEAEIELMVAFNVTLGLWLAASRDGRVWLTTDPANWAGASITLPGPVTAVETALNRFVLTGYGVVYTTDNGTKWGTMPVQTGVQLNAVAYGGTRWLVVGACGKTFYSDSLSSWVEVNSGAGENDLLWATYSEITSEFMCGGVNAVVMRSSDARVWKLCEALFRTATVEYGGYLPGLKRYFAVGDRFAMSTDGSTWSLYESPFKSARSGTTFPRGYQVLPTAKTILVYGTNTGVSIGRVTDRMYRTTDMAEARARHVQLTLPDGNVLVAGGESNVDVLDTAEYFDLVTREWSARATLPTPLRNANISTIPEIATADMWVPRGSRFGYANIESIVHVVGQDKFLAGGQNGILAKSDYGITWEQVDSPFPKQQLVGAVYNANRDSFLIAANSVPDNVARIRSSDNDGLSWSEETLSWPAGTIQDLTYLPRKKPDIFALSLHKPLTDGTRPNVATVARSRDGRVWQREDLTTEASVETRNNYYGVYIPEYDRYIVTVDGGVVSSADGDNWSFGGWGTLVGTGVIDQADKEHPWLAVAFGGGALMALRADGKVLLSYDAGTTWSRGTGVGDSYVTANVPTMFDSATWVAANKYLEYTSSLVYIETAGVWVAATSNGGISTSTDYGQSWTTVIAGLAAIDSVPKIYRLAHAEGTTLYVNESDSVAWSDDDGGTFADVPLAVGTVTESRAAALCWNSDQQKWLVGGKHLWALAGPSIDGITAMDLIPVRLARGPALTGEFVGGDLGGQRAVYQITCLDDVGESRPSEQFVIDIPNTTEGVGIALLWTKVPDVRGYRIYGRLAGAMYLLAEVGPEVVDWVDTGLPAGTDKMPATDTSGLAFLAQDDVKIAALTYISSLGITVVATREGHMAWSRDSSGLQSWYGVRNPNAADDVEFTTPVTTDPVTLGGSLGIVADGLAPGGQVPNPVVIVENDYGAGGMAFCAFLLAKESSAWYFISGDGGNIARSRNGDVWEYYGSPLPCGNLTRFAYDSGSDTLVVGSATQDFGRSQALPALLPVGAPAVAIVSGASTRPAALYRYWLVKERGNDQSWPSAASATVEVDAFGTEYPAIAVAADADATTIALYRQSDASPFTSDLTGVEFIGRIDAVGGLVRDRYDNATDSLTFTGAGLDDLVIEEASYLLAGTDIVRIRVKVVSTGTPDQVAVGIGGFDSDPEYGDPQDMVTGGLYLTGLHSGINLNFLADTGHTVGDLWDMVFRPTAVVQALPTADATFRDLGDEWTTSVNTLPGFACNAVTYINDTFHSLARFVAVSDGGLVAASETGAEWQFLEAQNEVVAGVDLRTIYSATVGTAVVAILGGVDKTLIACPDVFNTAGVASDTTDFTGTINDVHWNPYTKVFTAVGEGPSFGVSSDGRNWRQVYLNTDDALLTRSVAGDSSLFRHMVMGNNGAFLTSYDGRAWVNRDVGYETGSISTIISNGADELVVAGDGGAVCHSADGGVTWTQYDGGFGAYDVLAGCYVADSGTYVLVGKDGRASTSADGITWTPRTTNVGLFDFAGVANRSGTTAVIAVCVNGELIRSLDSGVTWTALVRPEVISGWTDIAASADVFLATSFDGKVAKSADNGLTWTVITVPTKPWYSRRYRPTDPQLIDYTAVCFGDSRFVIAGDQGDILVSDAADPTTFTLKESRLIGNGLRCLSFGSNTYLGGGERGVLVTSFTGFTEKVMLTGGSDAVGTSLVGCYVYDYVGDAWVAAADDLTGPRQQHAQVTMLDGSVLVIGGYDDTGTPLRTTERYLPHRDIWVSDLRIPYPKGYMRADKTDDGAIIATGSGCDPFYSALVLVPVVVPPAEPLIEIAAGIMQPGDYFYRISVSTVAGETVPTDPKRVTLTSTGGVMITWEPVPNAVTYNIYGRAAGSSDLIATVPGHLNKWLDVGLSVTSTQTFQRIDSTREIWFELTDEMPLPREGHGFSRIDNRFVSTGGYKDRRVLYLTPQPSNFVAPTTYGLGPYWDDGYTDPDYLEGSE